MSGREQCNDESGSLSLSLSLSLSFSLPLSIFCDYLWGFNLMWVVTAFLFVFPRLTGNGIERPVVAATCSMKIGSKRGRERDVMLM